jgi:uncharacterized protein (DUF1015 family)
VADLRPFFAYRPPPDLVKRVAAPPYDVVTTQQAQSLAEGNRDSFLHVSRPEIDCPPGTDEHGDEVYAKGRENLLGLVERKVLKRDQQPHLYVYEQIMGQHRQIGVVGCASVAEYDNDRIKKHEKTRPDKEDDRTRHILELAAHDEPVFLTYRADAAIDEAVELVMSGDSPVYDFKTDDDVSHRLWVIGTDISRRLSQMFSERVEDLYVADGHHRSAAASRAHRELKGDGREHDVFMVVVFPHNRMNILAYNRVVNDRQGRSAEQVLDAIRKKMDVVSTDTPEPDVPGSFGIYAGGQWYRATAMPGSWDADDPVARLDCQICQDQILAPIFGVEDPRTDDSIGFVGGIHGADELARRVDSGEATMGIYLYPTQMTQVMEVSDAGRVMPPKSTWFEPKLRSGLFVHTF